MLSISCNISLHEDCTIWSKKHIVEQILSTAEVMMTGHLLVSKPNMFSYICKTKTISQGIYAGLQYFVIALFCQTQISASCDLDITLVSRELQLIVQPYFTQTCLYFKMLVYFLC